MFTNKSEYKYIKSNAICKTITSNIDKKTKHKIYNSLAELYDKQKNATLRTYYVLNNKERWQNGWPQNGVLLDFNYFSNILSISPITFCFYVKKEKKNKYFYLIIKYKKNKSPRQQVEFWMKTTCDIGMTSFLQTVYQFSDVFANENCLINKYDLKNKCNSKFLSSLKTCINTEDGANLFMVSNSEAVRVESNIFMHDIAGQKIQICFSSGIVYINILPYYDDILDIFNRKNIIYAFIPFGNIYIKLKKTSRAEPLYQLTTNPIYLKKIANTIYFSFSDLFTEYINTTSPENLVDNLNNMLFENNLTTRTGFICVDKVEDKQLYLLYSAYFGFKNTMINSDIKKNRNNKKDSINSEIIYKDEWYSEYIPSTNNNKCYTKKASMLLLSSLWDVGIKIIPRKVEDSIQLFYCDISYNISNPNFWVHYSPIIQTVTENNCFIDFIRSDEYTIINIYIIAKDGKKYSIYKYKIKDMDKNLFNLYKLFSFD